MEKKIILNKKGDLGLFEFHKEKGSVEYVVATFEEGDENKGIGSQVGSWYWGRYFTDYSSALGYFNKKVQTL